MKIWDCWVQSGSDPIFADFKEGTIKHPTTGHNHCLHVKVLVLKVSISQRLNKAQLKPQINVEIKIHDNCCFLMELDKHTLYLWQTLQIDFFFSV